MEDPKINLPDENVYKVHILNSQNKVVNVIVYSRNTIVNDKKQNEMIRSIPNLAENNSIVYSKQQLLLDDSVRIIKKKILMDMVVNLQMNVCYEEIYLFAHSEQFSNINQLFELALIEQEQAHPQYIDKTLLYFETASLVFQSIGVNIGTTQKEYWTMDEFQRTIGDAGKTLAMGVPIGSKNMNATTSMFQANPFLVKSPNAGAYLEYLENSVLLNYGKLVNNTIHVCLAETVMEFISSAPNLTKEWVMDAYFRLLFKSNVKSSSDLFRVRTQLMKQPQNINHPETFQLYDNIQLFHDVYHTRKSDIQYSSLGIMSFHIQIQPEFQSTLPLEIIFKSVHASPQIPFIKYNPGERRENIYRLYFEKTSRNGKKIPLLEETAIMKLKRETGRSGQVSLCILHPFQETAKYIYLHFEQTGKVSIQCDLKRPMVETEIDALLRDVVNPVIIQINAFLEQTGFSIPKYQSMRSPQVSISKMKYIAELPIKNRIILKNLKCVYSVFNVFQDDLEKGNIEMRYKRVENYQEMDALNIFINEHKHDIPEAIEGLKTNFNKTEAEAKMLIASFFDNRMDSLGNVVDNPGFLVHIRLHKTLEQTKLVFEVEDITHIDYLKVLFVYIDSLVRMTQYINTSSFSRDQIAKVCKSGKVADPSHVKNVVAPSSAAVAAVVPKVAVVPRKRSLDFDLLEVLGINPNGTEILSGQQLVETQTELDEEGDVSAPPSVFYDDLVASDENENVAELMKSLHANHPELEIEEEEEEGVVFDDETDEIKPVSPSSPVSLPLPPSTTIVQTETPNKPEEEEEEEGVVFDEEDNLLEKPTSAVETKYVSTSDTTSKSSSVNSNPFSEEGVVFDDEDEYEGGMGGMRGGVDDENEDVYKTDPTGLSLKNPNPFLKRMTERDPDLFLTSDQGKYKAYAKKCQPINAQPVILTDEEKERIDREHPGSYRHAIKYGSNPKNKYWYICPRYWCFLTNSSLTQEEVDSGKCGSIIPKEATKIPKGSYVYEFSTKDHFDTQGKYIEHHPGFELKSDLHPKGYCLPCCFKNWNKGKQHERKQQCLQDDDASISSPQSEQDSIFGKDTAIVPITMDAKTTAQTFLVLGLDKVPLPVSRWGFLPIAAQQFLGTNYAKALDKDNQAFILPEKSVMLRFGVEQPKNQSFLGVFADVYAYLHRIPVPSVVAFKKILVEAIDLDVFVKLHHGALVSTFQPSTSSLAKLKNVFETAHEDTQFYKLNETRPDVLRQTVAAYNAFRKYILDNSQPIDHTYLWDAFSMAIPGIHADGVNLILLEVIRNDITDKIELICPSNVFSSQIYNTQRNSVVVLKHDEFYEPVYMYKRVNDVIQPQKTFTENSIHTSVKQMLLNIKHVSKKYCSPLPSMPKVYKFRQPVYVDELLYQAAQNQFTIEKQIMNYQGKIIGFSLSVVFETKPQSVFVPCFPSSVQSNLPIEHMDELSLWKPYATTRDVLTYISGLCPSIPCKPVMKVVDEDMIVGVFTESYQFVQINPPEENVAMDGLRVLNNVNMNTVDKTIATKTQRDTEREQKTKRILLETQFYTTFRSSVRKLINHSVNRTAKHELMKLIESKTLITSAKIEKVKPILQKLARSQIMFSDIDLDVLMELNDVTECSEFSHETSPYCIVKEDGTYQLILPKTHLLSGTSNETLYFTRLADELIRFGRVQTFMFQPKEYLNIRNIDYQVNQNEFLIIETALTKSYFEDIDLTLTNSHVENTGFEFAKPAYSQTYSSQPIPWSEQQYTAAITETGTGMGECIAEASIPIVGNAMSFWKQTFPSSARETVYSNQSPRCSFQVIIDVMKEIHNATLSVPELKKVLWAGYRNLVSIHFPKIVKILGMQGKNALMKPIRDPASFEALIFSESYVLSDLDIWVLAQTYQLPIILFTSTYLKGMPGRYTWLKLGETPKSKQFFFIRTTINTNPDNIGAYHLVSPALEITSANTKVFYPEYQNALLSQSKQVKPLTDMLNTIEFLKKKV